MSDEAVFEAIERSLAGFKRGYDGAAPTQVLDEYAVLGLRYAIIASLRRAGYEIVPAAAALEKDTDTKGENG